MGFNRGVENEKHYCYGVSIDIPISMIINENTINPPFEKYKSSQQQNTIIIKIQKIVINA